MKKKLSARDIHQLESLSQVRGKKNTGAVLGIDYGEKFCGLAWSPDGSVVFAIEVVERPLAAQKIEQILAEKNIKTLVFGLPLGSRNQENHICQQVREFAAQFETSERAIFFQNEQFSSQSVARSAERIDDLAAAKILEYWLEKE